MKKWYQYRCEESVGSSDIISYYLAVGLFIEKSLCKRLGRFLFARLYVDGIYWQYEASISDWRCVYGSVE